MGLPIFTPFQSQAELYILCFNGMKSMSVVHFQTQVHQRICDFYCLFTVTSKLLNVCFLTIYHKEKIHVCKIMLVTITCQILLKESSSIFGEPG